MINLVCLAILLPLGALVVAKTNSTAETKKKVLLVGESWVSAATHYKGFDSFGSVTFHLGAMPLVEALEGSEFELTYMTSHDAVEKFPFEMAGLDVYDVIILSDIGSNSLLLPPEVWLHSRTVPNRLKLIRAWVEKGGGLLMIGGYLSFQGIDAKARWRNTPVEDTLPVTCLPYDDRVEMPEGTVAQVVQPDHPVMEGLGGEWPLLLGVNEVEVRERADVEVIARLPQDQGGHPCSFSGGMATVGRPPGHLTSGRTGCLRRSPSGRGTPSSGRTSSAGSRKRLTEGDDQERTPRTYTRRGRWSTIAS